MKILIIQSINAASQNPKIAATVSTSTIGSGIATMLEWIPLEIGKLSILIGIILSLVLIYTHLKQHVVKMRLMEQELKNRKKRNGRQDRRDDLVNMDNMD